MALADLQAKMAQLQTDTAAEHTVDLQILADVQKLLAGASAGPGIGQVVVNESDLDALTQTASDIDTQVVADTAAATAADATVNPPAPPAGS